MIGICHLNPELLSRNDFRSWDLHELQWRECCFVYRLAFWWQENKVIHQRITLKTNAISYHTGADNSTFRNIEVHAHVPCFAWSSPVMGLLPDTYNCRLPMRRECREDFPRHHGLVTPTWITARAWHTCRDACWDRWLAVSFEIGDAENIPAFPALAQPAIFRDW